MDGWTIFTIILWIGIIGWGIWELIQYFRRKNAATIVSKEEFKENMRKAQVVDVRGKDEFDAGHILGARNLPYLQMKQRANELRKDQPIYLYDEKKTLSARSAIILKKQGYQNLYILKGGYADWDGKIKRKKMK
ncbi:sulfurtransferase [Marinilactibacillus sp. 15R]|uniref:Rhodanese-related sulfurtransferase n=1 Tax=Marinilactibacillus piezotolerans TaxID=258723 RepID=A0A1I3V3Q0_9LACT|nr:MULTISPECIES: rhodanese-like domain-containing protein [Marinilactibacillus]API89569.1 sulfurtransferase [Marinilactibacillus sp. 15R]SFJ89740.1 Rhodanese-related sulfurtransferase [Marinilactibacillus piezotolerans]